MLGRSRPVRCTNCVLHKSVKGYMKVFDHKVVKSFLNNCQLSVERPQWHRGVPETIKEIRKQHWAFTTSSMDVSLFKKKFVCKIKHYYLLTILLLRRNFCMTIVSHQNKTIYSDAYFWISFILLSSHIYFIDPVNYIKYYKFGPSNKDILPCL